MTALLQVRNLHVNYGKVEAVHGVDIAVGGGEIVSIIGSNGAGKSTTLAAIMGLLAAGQGEIIFDGHVMAPSGVERRVAAGLGLVTEKRDLFGEMSVEDNLLLGAFQRYRHGQRDHGETMAEVFAMFPRLQERRTQMAATLSGGERQMLAIGRALMAKPRLLMLDEPSLGLAPLVVRDIFQVIADLRRRGVAILLVEQNARAALQLADHAYVLEMGRVALAGSAAELAGDARVVEAYLGLGGKHQDRLAAGLG